MKLSNCCFCISLRTGSQIIGWIQLVATVFIALAIAAFLVLGTLLAAGTFEGRHPSAQHIDPQVRTVGVVITIILAIKLIFFIVQIAFNITLLVGISKNKRGHVKAYLIYTTINLVLALIPFFVSLGSGLPVLGLILAVIVFSLVIYCLLVIKSYYHEMGTHKPTGVSYNPA